MKTVAFALILISLSAFADFKSLTGTEPSYSLGDGETGMPGCVEGEQHKTVLNQAMYVLKTKQKYDSASNKTEYSIEVGVAFVKEQSSLSAIKPNLKKFPATDPYAQKRYLKFCSTFISDIQVGVYFRTAVDKRIQGQIPDLPNITFPATPEGFSSLQEKLKEIAQFDKGERYGVSGGIFGGINSTDLWKVALKETGIIDGTGLPEVAQYLKENRDLISSETVIRVQISDSPNLD